MTTATLPATLSMDDYFPKGKKHYLFGEERIPHYRLSETQQHIVQELNRSISRYNSLIMSEVMGVPSYALAAKLECYKRLIEIAVAEAGLFTLPLKSYHLRNT